MALRRLTSGEMIHTTLTWVDTRHRHHQLLAAVPEVGGLLSHLGRAHKGLLDCQPTANPQAAGLARMAEELDGQHDDLVGGLVFVDVFTLPRQVANRGRQLGRGQWRASTVACDHLTLNN